MGRSIVTPPPRWLAVVAVGLALLASAVADAHPLDTWHLRSSPTTQDLFDVAYGAGGFVIVGNAGTILTSPDGVTWTSQVSGITADLHGVTFALGLYVAVGDAGTILTSPDGVTWTARASSTTRALLDVAFGNGVFAAVGGCGEINCGFSLSGIILTSVDAAAWTAVTPFPLSSLHDIKFDGVGFTAAGTDFFLGDSFGCNGDLVTSLDGTAWAHPDPIVPCPEVVAVGNGTHLAVGLRDVGARDFDTEAATSSDGVTWVTAAPPPFSVSALAFGDALFVAATSTANAILSGSDGVTWTARPTGITGFLRGVAYVNHQFIALGEGGIILQSAPTSFADVPVGHWAFDFIRTLYYVGVSSGCGGVDYCPDALVPRAQMAVFLERGIHGAGYSPPAASGIFTDIPADHPFIAWIEALFADSVTGGCGINPLQYCPNDIVTRGQMAVFLLRAKHGAGYQPPAATGVFADVPISGPSAHPFAGWIEQLASEGITGGCGTNPARYCPDGPVTRGQMAVFLVRAFNLPM